MQKLCGNCQSIFFLNWQKIPSTEVIFGLIFSLVFLLVEDLEFYDPQNRDLERENWKRVTSFGIRIELFYSSQDNVWYHNNHNMDAIEIFYFFLAKTGWGKRFWKQFFILSFFCQIWEIFHWSIVWTLKQQDIRYPPLCCLRT